MHTDIQHTWIKKSSQEVDQGLPNKKRIVLKRVINQKNVKRLTSVAYNMRITDLVFTS